MKAMAIGLLAVAMLAACGGSSVSQPAGSIKVTMTEYSFNPSTINAPAGKVVFFLVNVGSVSHDMVIRDSTGSRAAASELVSAGDSFVFTLDNLSAGTFTYFCDQTGHEAEGMKGTLTIT